MSVGLDIGSKTIKIVELSREGQNYRLRGSGVVGYTSGVSTEHLKDEKEMQAVADIIRKLHKDAKISSREISIALPESLVFTRTIRFPPLTDAEINSAVQWEAEQYIPIPKDEAITRHQILERRENVIPPEVLVLLVAAPKVVADKYIKVAQMAGLTVVGLETELMSLTRALAPADKTVLILDFGAKSTDIAIARRGNLVFSRSIPTAGDAFTRALSQGLGIEYSQAEEYKRVYGMNTSQLEGRIKNNLDPVFKIVTDEIKKAIHFYQTEEKGDTPTLMMLSGGTSGMPEILSSLTGYLGLEVLIANPFGRVLVDQNTMKSLLPYAPLYSIALGLALRNE